MHFVTVLELLGMLKPLLVTYPFIACDFTIAFIEKPSSATHHDKISSNVLLFRNFVILLPM